MRRSATSFLLLLVFATAAGCGTGSSGSGPAPAQRTSLYGPITLEEIQRSHAATAYDLVQALRPNWLHVRGQTRVRGGDEIVVYMNNVRMGTVGSLRDVNAADLRAVEFLDARRAMLRFGSGHEAGAILLSARS